MVKILACGDFHGTFPNKLKSLIKKEKIDLIVSNGDYLPFHYRKLWFKYCYKQERDLADVIGKKKHLGLLKKDLDDGENSLRKLNNLKIPVFTVLGNIDHPDPSDVCDHKEKRKKSLEIDEKIEFQKRLKKYKNIKRIDYSFSKFEDYVFIGMRGHSFPGVVKSKGFKKHKIKLEKLFKKFKNKKIIFVSHNVPYGVLDKIGNHAHKEARGKHTGSKLTQRIIKQQQPFLAIGGHVHESKGKKKMGKTLVINPGAAHEGQAAIIELDKNKIKKLKFI